MCECVGGWGWETLDSDRHVDEVSREFEMMKEEEVNRPHSV